MSFLYNKPVNRYSSDKCDELTNVVKDFDDPAVDVENPRYEVSKILKYLKKTLMDSWAKDLSDITKVSGATYSRLLMMRR